MDKKPAFQISSKELASTIYVDLVGRSVVVSGTGVTMAVSAENLARLSFKLAAAFQEVEDQLNAENMPKNQGFTVDVSNIAEWTTK
jgi:hypothetical protein